MTDNATSKRSYSRPTKYPAAIPRTMTTERQRGEIDAFAAERKVTLGEAVRYLIGLGLNTAGKEG